MTQPLCPLSVAVQAPLLASQILTMPSPDADASRVESCEKATELTELLCPSSVAVQALRLSPMSGFIVIQSGSPFLKRPLIRLPVGLNKSADAYACRGLFSTAHLCAIMNRRAS